MGHGKESPRQKMIGMMYLVLTALLALNVSAEVLNAFILVDVSLRKSYVGIEKKNDAVYSRFDEAMTDPGQKAKTLPWKKEADEVKKIADSLFNYIDTLKNLLVFTAEGDESEYISTGGDPHHLKAKQENNVGGQLMLLEKRADVLKKQINDMDSSLVDVIIRTAPKGDTSKYSSIIDGIRTTLKTDSILGHVGVVSWQHGYFDQLPMAAVLTMLSKLQSDVRSAESDILNYLLSQIDAGSWKFNKIEAIVNAPTNYVLKGNKYYAEVFIAASDSTTDPEIVLTGGRKLPIKNGKGIQELSPSSTGFVKWGGVIRMESPVSGEMLEYAFNSEFQVAESELIVSPTQMNVFYIGVPNPVDVSVAGVPADKVVASITSGNSIRKIKGSQHVVNVKRPGKVYISATAKFDDGTSKNMGRKEFRVKRVPDPIGKVANKTGGLIERNILLAQQGVKADLENFDFNLRFKVVAFTVSGSVRGYNEEEKSRSFRFTNAQKELIKKVSSGKKVYIEDIKVKAPNGEIRNLPSAVVFKIR
ncbi:MAG: gliding motility protein GldM [Bacteroidales bacterium]|nr:gliding motility protein GldM [Bacteroidales bacterium]